jgi:hypothetical protein
MMKRLIFISCGQQTEEEKSLGLQIQAMIDGTAEFEAYFAQSVQDLDSLSQNIFEALSKCSGAIIFLHNRGKALDLSDKEWGYRSSVWVNQEIAILSYRRHIEAQKIPLLIFKDKKVNLEGAMTSLIGNPFPLKETTAILEQIKTWLAESKFPPCLHEEFNRKWEQISDVTRRFLSCLLDEGGEKVNEVVIRECLKSKFNRPDNETARVILGARLDFNRTSLVIFERNEEALYEFSIHPTWAFYVRRAIDEWRGSKGGHH